MTIAPAGRACLLTPPARGAIAVIVVEGAAALAAINASFQPANGKAISRQQADRVLFGLWTALGVSEEVIVVRLGEDREMVEIHCHGGVAASQRILNSLAAAGCVIESWRERSVRRGTSLIEAEADDALARATTRRAAAILLQQRQGALRSAVDAVVDEITAGRIDGAALKLAELSARSTLGLHLTESWRVAIAGQPNVGKSSLINVLAGYQRAIVFNEPGTTRDVLTVETAIDGWPVRLADAAGIRATDDALEQEGVARARRELIEADLVLWILDGSTLAAPPRATAERQWQGSGVPLADRNNVLLVVNKSDLMSPDCRWPADQNVVTTSATTGAGIADLLAAIAERLTPRRLTVEAAPFTQRHVELIRQAEHALSQLAVDESLALLAQL